MFRKFCSNQIIREESLCNIAYIHHLGATTVTIQNPTSPDFKCWIQWGFKIRTSLEKEVGLQIFEWDLKSGSPAIWNLYKWMPFYRKPFEIRPSKSPEFISPLFKCLADEWSGFWMAMITQTVIFLFFLQKNSLIYLFWHHFNVLSVV